MSKGEDPIVVQEARPPALLDRVHSSVHVLSGEPLKDLLENYIHYYASGETHTARAKQYDLEHFLAFLADKRPPGDVLVAEWTLQRTKDFVDLRLALGEAPTTVARRLATIKHLGRTLAERVPGYLNPAREVKSPKLALPRPRGLTAEEIATLRCAAVEMVRERPDSFSAARNHFLLELLLATGLRADEVRLLVLGQLAEDRKWLKNVRTKGKRFRNVYLDSQIRSLVGEYLDRRRKELTRRFPGIDTLDTTEHAKFPVLVSFYRARVLDPKSFGLSPKSIWNGVAILGKRAQLIAPAQIGRLHPHRLRHAFAHGLLDSSKDIRLVAQALGHTDVRTTMRYTERTEDEIALAIEKRRLEE